ncbi:unnamed protein product [Blepharisma stoltei]|uniref:Uncharacterized protein n=1 Tax=Blepharisma stoltei TaxID=1481888 RepID=A0AAU9K6N9_9CILI|nr:unnamed protein product [Blepharisma stoltei]
MLNLVCLLADILIVQSDKNKGSQNWINEARRQFEAVVDWHYCNYTAISECLDIYPDTLIVLDLSDDFEIQLSLISTLWRKQENPLGSSEKVMSLYYYDEWTYTIVSSHSAQMNAYFAVLDCFNWTQGLVISDEDNIYSKKEFFRIFSNF